MRACGSHHHTRFVAGGPCRLNPHPPHLCSMLRRHVAHPTAAGRQIPRGPCCAHNNTRNWSWPRRLGGVGYPANMDLDFEFELPADVYDVTMASGGNGWNSVKDFAVRGRGSKGFEGQGAIAGFAVHCLPWLCGSPHPPPTCVRMRLYIPACGHGLACARVCACVCTCAHACVCVCICACPPGSGFR